MGGGGADAGPSRGRTQEQVTQCPLRAAESPLRPQALALRTPTPQALALQTPTPGPGVTTDVHTNCRLVSRPTCTQTAVACLLRPRMTLSFSSALNSVWQVIFANDGKQHQVIERSLLRLSAPPHLTGPRAHARTPPSPSPHSPVPPGGRNGVPHEVKAFGAPGQPDSQSTIDKGVILFFTKNTNSIHK